MKRGPHGSGTASRGVDIYRVGGITSLIDVFQNSPSGPFCSSLIGRADNLLTTKAQSRIGHSGGRFKSSIEERHIRQEYQAPLAFATLLM